ncbi:S8 family peptidase [Psychroserpens sp.]|uniref:S8 family peptidase n=1 Tax=Psychroserpens sp. TaxID=2020870 RepID=UPI002B27AC5C|nr:S8 family peptidase [Psychroserpens sp.]
MIRILQILSILCCLSLNAQNQSTLNYAEAQVIVKFKTDLAQGVDYITEFSKGKLAVLNDQLSVSEYKIIGNKKTQNTFLIHYNATTSVEDVVQLYKNTNAFEYVEPNFVCSGNSIPNDPNFATRQWSMVNNGTFPLSPATVNADIDMDLAWDIETGDPNLIVAVLDSGMKLNHPEFAGRIWFNTSEVLDGMDNDNNNYIDDIYGGWDFANSDNDPTDDHGHGTNVGGIALATGNNGIGYAGVNWNSQIMAVKILDNNNSGFYSWMADGIYYAVDNGAKVMNMSVGGNSPSTTLLDAVDYAYANNVALVVSTGNGDTALQYPSRYANAIAVGSTNPDDSRTSPFFWDPNSGSNFGPEIDFVAPGNFIYGLSYNSNTNYNSYWGGTSQAAPHVAGVISLMVSIDPNVSVDVINTILIATSEDQVGPISEDIPGFDNYFGHGRINAFQAVTSALLSVDDLDGNLNAVSMYPNPISNEDLLNFINLKPSTYDVTVYTISGQNVTSFSLDARSQVTRTKLPQLDSGIYFMDIKDVITSNSITKKLIIK